MTDAIALPDGPALTALFVRMLGTATFVIVIALLSERSGPFLAAMMASLPIYTGPIYLFLAFEHGPDYLAQMAVGSTAIAAATPVFAIVYCILALRFGLGTSLSSALLAWARLRRSTMIAALHEPIRAARIADTRKGLGGNAAPARGSAERCRSRASST